MKKTVKSLYNILAIILVVLSMAFFVNIAFAENLDFVDETVFFPVGDYIIELGGSENNFFISCQAGCNVDTDFDVIVNYYLGENNINTTVTANENVNNTIIFGANSTNELDTNNIIYIIIIFPNGDSIYIENNQTGTGFFYEVISAVVVDTGFGSFLGSTTPLTIINDVTGGVQDTTGAISPAVAFAGIPIAFGIGTYLIWFIRRSTF